MNKSLFANTLIVALLLGLPACRPPCPAGPAKHTKGDVQMVKGIDRAGLEQALLKKFGQTQAARIKRGLDQVLARWPDYSPEQVQELRDQGLLAEAGSASPTGGS